MATSGRRSSAALSSDASVNQPAQEIELPGPGSALRGPESGAAPLNPNSVHARLLREGYSFDFFQAVRLLEQCREGALPVGRDSVPAQEAARFCAMLSFIFPPSSIHQIKPPVELLPVPEMTVAFMGLTGPSGLLPHHYTEQLLRMERESKHPERSALRSWLDLFNHRMISHFFRAWEKYRFYLAYERGEHLRQNPDSFTRAVSSLMGLGLPALRRRLRVDLVDPRHEEPPETLAAIPDAALFRYAGLLAHRPRTAKGLAAILSDYFEVPVEVCQFHGQWLNLDPENQTQLVDDGHCLLGAAAVIGRRVWDEEGMIRLKIGSLRYAQFSELLPDPDPTPDRKAQFLLQHLVRLYIGPTLTFDVQLTLQAAEVPLAQLGNPEPPGSRLGWNAWIYSRPVEEDKSDAVFVGSETFQLNRNAGSLGIVRLSPR